MITLQVGVKAFLKDPDGRYLLVRRNMEKYKKASGTWDIVGGRIEPGSKLIDNLRREVKEETQLEVLSEPRLIYAQDIIPNDERHIVRLTYTAETKGDPILDTSENVEFKWLTIEELKRQPDLDAYVKEILEKGILK